MTAKDKTASDLLDCLRFSYGVERARDIVVLIPHQRPASTTVKRSSNPPVEEDGDRYVAGDHDLHLSLELPEAIGYSGHQSLKVRSLVQELVACLENASGFDCDVCREWLRRQ